MTMEAAESAGNTGKDSDNPVVMSSCYIIVWLVHKKGLCTAVAAAARLAVGSAGPKEVMVHML